MILKAYSVPTDLMADAKRAATLAGQSLSSWVIETVRLRLGGCDDDTRGTGSSEAGTIERAGNGAALPDVRKAKSDTKRLHPLQPVRPELDQRGAGDRPSSASHSTHRVYRDGDRQWCSNCKLHF